MLKGFTDNGELKDIKVTENGELKVAMGGGGGETQQTVVTNTSENPVPVNVTNIQDVETTLNASLKTVGQTVSQIAVNKKVTTIDIANYSETANVTITVGNLQAVIGNNIATTLTINANVDNINLVATEDNTKVQIIVKGVN
jgi:hypothetical protein